MLDQQEREYRYDILRILLVAFVVLGHSTYYMIDTAFGGMDYIKAMEASHVTETNVHNIASLLTKWIYTFHMPAFIALSGMLFARQLKSNRFASLQELIKSKAKRLLMPLLAVYFLWNIPWKLISGYYQGQNLFRAFIGQFLFPNSMYLWYLEALFLDFLLAYVLCKYIPKWLQVVIVLILWVIGVKIQQYAGYYELFGNPLKYLLWFYVGIHMEGIQKIRYRCFNDLGNAFLMEALHLVTWFVAERTSHGGRLLESSVVPLFGILAFYFLSLDIEKRLGESAKKNIVLVSSYGFGVYLYAEPLNYLILFLAKKWFGIGFFGSELGALVIYLSRVFLTSLAAVGIVKLLKKCRLKTLY